ncbi:MAG: triose-phosphate isomerase [Pseudomonadota bacterium]
MTEIQPLVAGNWKMNGTRAALAEIEKLSRGLKGHPADGKADVMLCPPATLLAAAVEIGGIAVGAQDCHVNESGAHTGDISAEMLADAGAKAVIVGHSERRADHGESNATVAAKAEAVWRAGLTAIICVGESEAQRKSGDAIAVVTTQLRASVPKGATASNCTVAYEPVWAIGTGLTPTVDDVADMHAAIRTTLVETHGGDGAAMRVLYGGSVQPGNAQTLMAVENVNGALVGGASLKADDFLGIISAYA